MRRIRSDCYEAQLTPEELAALQEMLLQPKLDLPKIQAAVPPWRNGPRAGCKPSLRTLSAVATRFRGHLHACELRDMVTQLHSMCFHAEELPSLPTRPILKLICSLLGHNLLRKLTDGTFSETDAPLLRLFIKLEDQNRKSPKQGSPEEQPQFVIDELFQTDLEEMDPDTHEDDPVFESPSQIDQEQSYIPPDPNPLPSDNPPPASTAAPAPSPAVASPEESIPTETPLSTVATLDNPPSTHALQIQPFAPQSPPDPGEANRPGHMTDGADLELDIGRFG